MEFSGSLKDWLELIAVFFLVMLLFVGSFGKDS